MKDWTQICALEDIPRQGARTVESAAGRIAVFRTGADEVFALRDRCPHKGGPLSQGMVCGSQVTCPLHGWTVALAEGRAVAPDVGETSTFPAKVEGGMVLVQINT